MTREDFKLITDSVHEVLDLIEGYPEQNPSPNETVYLVAHTLSDKLVFDGHVRKDLFLRACGF